MKIVTVVGARPQFVKAAVVSAEFAKHDSINEVLVHTGQHFDENMSQMFFNEMRLKAPDYYLGINNLPHGAMTGRMIEHLEKILINEKPDWVLVFGDTDTTLAASIAAKKLNLRLAHVEAGLRSFNNEMPEEINRIVTDRISDLMFCPTQNAAANLLREGTNQSNIVVCGDVMKDAMLKFRNQMKKPNISVPENYILCTLHRSENIDNSENLESLNNTIEKVNDVMPVVMPLHPHTRKALTNSKIDIENSKTIFIEPVSYLEMAYLLHNSRMVITDSGGLQKEAYFSKKMCVTLRNETEWTELVEHGYNILAGTESENIIKKVNFALSLTPDFSTELYGDGKACEKITKYILQTTK